MFLNEGFKNYISQLRFIARRGNGQLKCITPSADLIIHLNQPEDSESYVCIVAS